MSRPSFDPTDEQRRTVRAMAAYGIPQTALADVIGISAPTLRLHFRVELDTAAAEANARVAENLFKRATGDGPQAVTAAIFWLKCRAGWRDQNQDIEQLQKDQPAAEALTGSESIEVSEPSGA